MALNKKILFVYIFVLLTSPFVWILSKNIRYLAPSREKFAGYNYQYYVDDVNTLRGDLIQNRIPVVLSRVMVNRYSNFLYENVRRYFVAYDPSFLFFTGDNDLHKSTRSTGPIFLSLLIPFLFGLYRLIDQKKYLPLLILLISPIPSSFMVLEIETVYRIPFFIIFIYIASFGFLEIYKKKRFKYLYYCVILFYLFETLRFYNDFLLHYPYKL